MIMKKQSEYISGLCTLMAAALFCFIMAGCADNEVDFPDKVDKVKITSIVVDSNVEDFEGTRSNNHTWENGDELYIKLNDGAGFATYHDGVWEFAQLEGEENLGTFGTYTDYSCYVKFFKGDYERIQDENGKYFVKPGSDCIVYTSYTGNGNNNTGKYTLTSDGKLIVSASLKSELNRVRMCADNDYSEMDLRLGGWRKEQIEMFDPVYTCDHSDFSVKTLDFSLADDGKYYSEYVYFYNSTGFFKVSDYINVYARQFQPKSGGSLTIKLPSESSYEGWVMEKYQDKLVKFSNLPIISGASTSQEELTSTVGASVDGMINYELIDPGQNGSLSLTVTGGLEYSFGNSFYYLSDYRGELDFSCMSILSNYYLGTNYTYRVSFSGSNILIGNGDQSLYLSNF